MKRARSEPAVVDPAAGVPEAIAVAVRQAVENHLGERGPLLVMLHDIQRTLGYVPAAAVPMLAHALNISRADVFGVISFYHDFRSEPAGRRTVRICRAEACQSMGSDQLVRQACDSLGVDLGDTTSDGALTLDQVFCLGNCALAPSVEVDGRLYGRVDSGRLDGLLSAAGPMGGGGDRD